MAYVGEIWVPEGVPLFPRERCIKPEWNPNTQDPKTFKNLVDSIREHGFLDLPQLWPISDEKRAEYVPHEIDDGGPFWLIVGGSHRWDAAGVLDMPKIPGVEVPHWDEDMAKMQNMRLNMLKGRIDPTRFRALYDDLLDKGYEEEVLKIQMGLVREAEFKRLVKGVRDNLPEEMRNKLDDAEDEIHTTDDLQRVLNEMFSKHGDTLPFSYFVFEFGGKTHTWVKMTRKSRDLMQDVQEFCYDRQLDINLAFEHLLKDSKARLEEVEDALLEKAETVDFS